MRLTEPIWSTYLIITDRDSSKSSAVGDNFLWQIAYILRLDRDASQPSVDLKPIFLEIFFLSRQFLFVYRCAHGGDAVRK